MRMRVSQFALNSLCGRVRAAEHTPRDRFYLLERRYGLPNIVERGARVTVEHLCVSPPHFYRLKMILSESADHRHHLAQHRLGFFEAPQLTKGLRIVVGHQARVCMNQEHNSQNHSNFGFGWHPMNLRVGHQENVSQFSGGVRRQHFSLFANDKTEKHAWHTTLNTVTNSSREWAYVGHEIKDSCAYITGKKK